MVFQDDQNAPDCKDTPALPFPFDARDLAAFMLDGVGAFVADYYGDWEDGPETESLNDIDPSNNYARRAVREAFDAYRQALCPTARDVVEAWRNNAPAEIAKVLPDGFDYYDANGNTKTAGIDAIRNAIKRMTSAR